MLSKEMCSTVTFSRGSLSNSAKELLQSKDFYFLTELYCNKVFEEDQRVRDFLNCYFNDEGYVDCWRIPHLLIDLHGKNYEHHAGILNSPEFAPFFFYFLLDFYNYCMTAYKPFALGDWAFKNEKDAVLHMSLCRHQVNLIMDSFSRIIENIESYRAFGGGR